MKIIKEIKRKIELQVLRRNQFTSKKLRELFSVNYNVHVGMYSYGCFDPWRMRGPMRVGRYCSIANTVRTSLVNHPVEAITTHPMLYETRFGVVDHSDIGNEETLVIEDDVWIGHNVMILSGCKFIGRGAIIGAGAIVTRNVPAYEIVAGNPARTLRVRFPAEMIEALEASRWWEREPSELAALQARHPGLLHAPTPGLIRAAFPVGV
jgi:acetyltransferase-like isoleucine patch superfamily enzyme